jgi:hypothetical protein
MTFKDLIHEKLGSYNEKNRLRPSGIVLALLLTQSIGLADNTPAGDITTATNNTFTISITGANGMAYGIYDLANTVNQSNSPFDLSSDNMMEYG